MEMQLCYIFNCSLVDRVSNYMIALFILVEWGRSIYVCCLFHRGSSVDFVLHFVFIGVVLTPRRRCMKLFATP